MMYFGQYWFFSAEEQALPAPTYQAPPFNTTIVSIRRRKARNS